VKAVLQRAPLAQLLLLDLKQLKLLSLLEDVASLQRPKGILKAHLRRHSLTLLSAKNFIASLGLR
jgi:hypothetical protein